MSRGVRDADGSLLASENREKVGDLLVKTNAFGILYSAVDLNPKTDISEEVNKEVLRTRGDAVVNLKVTNSQCPMNFIYPLTLLPIWPGCVTVRIHGDIIRKKAAPVAPATPVTPATPATPASSTAPSVAQVSR
jgi:hypothetical protein